MPPSPNVAILSDEQEDYGILQDLLEREFSDPSFKLCWLDSDSNIEDRLKELLPDIIFLDDRFKFMEGISGIPRIQKLVHPASILVLTEKSGDALGNLAERAGLLGAFDCIPKDQLSSPALLKLIQYALRNARQNKSILREQLQLEEILRDDKMAVWSESTEDEDSIFISESIKSLTGYSKEEIESREILWYDCVHPEDRSLSERLWLRAKEGRKTKGMYRFVRKDGAIIWLSEKLNSVRNPSNTHFHVRGVLRDLTDRHDHEERYRLLASALEQSSEGIMITDSQLEQPGPKIIYVNKAVSWITGYDADELIGKTPRIFQGPKTDRNILSALSDACRQGKDFSAEAVNYRKNGEEYIVTWHIHPIRDSNGNITNFIGSIRDISEKFEIQQQRELDQKFLSQVGELAKIGAWRYNKITEEIFLSKEVYRIYGVNKNEPVSLEKGISFYQGDSRKKILKHFQDCVDNGIPYDLFLHIKNAKGEDLKVRAKGQPWRENGNLIGVWGLLQDITELSDLQIRNKNFYDLAAELSCVASLDGYYLELDNRWEQALGMPLEDIKSQHILKLIHPEDVEKTSAAIKQLLRTKELIGFENRYRHRDGHYIHFAWNAVLGPNQNVIYALAHDISGQKENEIQLQEALVQATQANLTKNQFLMVMSHEMRTPLNPIMGYAELLLNEIKDDKQREALGIIRDSARHLTSLISDVLDIASIDAGRTKLEKELFDPRELITSTMKILEPKITEKKLGLFFRDNDYQKHAEGLVCVGDKRKLRQIILNLLNNACKFTEKGSVTVVLESPHFNETTANLRISVTDTGIGIPEEDQEKIFEPFHQVAMSATRSYGGQGLGLALCREYANMMKGRISVESEPGKGSRFTLSVNLEVEKYPDYSSVPIRDAATTPPFTDMVLSALVAEDDLTNQLIMKRLLDRLGVKPLIAKNGVQALEMVRANEFDIIFMDIQMPEMDGLEATRAIRSSDLPNSKIPIVAVSAHALDGIKQEALEAGMVDFIEKPLSLNKLSTVLQNLRDNFLK